MDESLDELLRRSELDQQRHGIEEKARAARERGDLAQAATLWRASLDLAQRAGDGFTQGYVEGQLADVLIEAGQTHAAKQVLEASLAAGNFIPFASSLLTDLYMEEGAFEDAFRVQRRSWILSAERVHGNGMPMPDPTPQIVSFAKWWKDSGAEAPIILAENWAQEAQSREAWFAVRHERAQWLEKGDSTAAALELYLELIREGTRHDATYTRAMVLLDRAKRTQESLDLARAALGIGLSASLEEQARKRIARLEKKGAEPATRGARAGARASKSLVPAFSVRTGERNLRWVGQVEITGGISTMVATPEGVFIMGGTEFGLWWSAGGTTEALRLRAIPKRTQLFLGQAAALVSDEGKVSEGAARVEIVGQDWTTAASFSLPGVTSEVAQTSWGLAIGCRTGSLYALDWSGHLRWRFDLPQDPDASAYGRACPYLVSNAETDGVVFSTHGEVYALNVRGEVGWKWQVPAHSTQHVDGPISVIMTGGDSVSALQATRDGGALIASMSGDVYRVNGKGKVVWSIAIGHNTSQLLTDEQDQLVAVAHARGVNFVDGSRRQSTVMASQRWLRVARSLDGQTTLVREGKLLHVLDASGRESSVVEFSRPISEAAFVGSRIVVAAGKLISFEVA